MAVTVSSPEGTQVVRGQTYEEALFALRQDLGTDVLIYPHATKAEVHVRKPDERGEYPTIEVYTTSEPPPTNEPVEKASEDQAYIASLEASAEEAPSE